MPLDVLFVRDDDIPDLVQEDVCDLGLVGLNVLEEKRLELAGAGRAARASSRCARWISAAAGCRSRCRTASSYEGAASLRGKRIATTYPFMLANYLRAARCARRRSSRCPARWKSRRGSGRADLICDLVSTGSTLQANHLREVETVLESHAVHHPHAARARRRRKTSGSSAC